MAPAILLNFFGMGAGYLYLGRPWRALALCIASLAALAVYFSPAGGILASPIPALVVIVGSTVVLLAVLIDTAAIARRSQAHALAWYNRVPIYAAGVLGSFLVGSADILSGGRIRPAVRSFNVPTLSMEPGLRLGDHFIADLGAYRDGDGPRRGDVIVFRHPRQSGVVFVKRVVGLPGERVQMIGGIVHIDGRPVPTVPAGRHSLVSATGSASREVTSRAESLPGGPTITVLDAEPNGPLDNTAEMTVPADHYIVLGDNRDDSLDSRTPLARGGIGPVPRSLIEGRAAWIYWSSHPSRFLMRL